MQLRLEFDGAYQNLEIFSMAVIGSDGRELWSLMDFPQDTLQITGARLVESTTGGLKLARQEGRTRLELPELAGQNELRLRYSLRIRHDVQDLIRDRETMAKKLKAADKQQARLQKALTSAVEWQKRPWFRRVFSRWKPPAE